MLSDWCYYRRYLYGDVGALHYRVAGLTDTAGNITNQTAFTEIAVISAEGYGDDDSLWARRTKSQSILERLSGSVEWAVRVYLALNPSTSCDILETLKTDANSFVRNVASGRYIARGCGTPPGN